MLTEDERDWLFGGLRQVQDRSYDAERERDELRVRVERMIVGGGDDR